MLIAVALLAPPAFCQDTTDDTSPATAAANAPDQGPVAVPEPSELALKRHRTGNAWWVFNQFWGAFIPLLFLFTGFSAKIRDWATRIGRWWFFIIAVYFILYSIITFLIDLPLSYLQGFARPHAYGLSNQTFLKWLQDTFISLGVGTIMGVLFLWIPYLLLKKSPKRWWLYTALLVPPFLLFQMLITPVFISPLFNDFGPMQNKELEAKILAIADQAGIEGSRVYEVNKSVDTKAINAYVTGFLGSKRIVLWDTLLTKLDEEEVLFVMAHEMGHYVLNHVLRTIVIISVLIGLALYLIHRVSRSVLRRYKDRFGFTSLSDIASLPLILLMLHVFSFLITPAILGLSRYHEREADRFGVEITRSNHAAATAFVKLQQENLGVPWHGWLYTLWRDSHPTIGQRITFFNEYRPWETGDPVVYEEYFDRPAGGAGEEESENP
jgi:Zn-dependent protease with chaperone function